MCILPHMLWDGPYAYGIAHACMVQYTRTGVPYAFGALYAMWAIHMHMGQNFK